MKRPRLGFDLIVGPALIAAGVWSGVHFAVVGGAWMTLSALPWFRRRQTELVVVFFLSLGGVVLADGIADQSVVWRWVGVAIGLLCVALGLSILRDGKRRRVQSR